MKLENYYTRHLGRKTKTLYVGFDGQHTFSLEPEGLLKSLEYPDNEFDNIVMLNSLRKILTLSFVGDDPVSQVRRILKEGGRLITIDPVIHDFNHESIKEIFGLDLRNLELIDLDGYDSHYMVVGNLV